MKSQFLKSQFLKSQFLISTNTNMHKDGISYRNKNAEILQTRIDMPKGSSNQTRKICLYSVPSFR